MSRPRVNSGIARIKAARRRQAIILAVLVTVMGAVWVRNYVLDSVQSAKAQSPAAGEPQSPEARSDDPAPRSARGEIHIEWPVRPTRDLFTIDRSAYVRRPIEVVVEPVVVAPPVEVPDVPAGPTDEELAARGIKTLSLQGTVQGEVPTAFINGRSWRVGDTVNGFVLVGIGTRSVVLRFRNVEVTLEM